MNDNNLSDAYKNFHNNKNNWINENNKIILEESLTNKKNKKNVDSSNFYNDYCKYFFCCYLRK